MMLNKSSTFSIIITSALWFIFFIVVIVVPVGKNEDEVKFSTVKIQIGDSKPVKNLEPIPEKTPILEQKPVEQESVEQKSAVVEEPVLHQEAKPVIETKPTPVPTKTEKPVVATKPVEQPKTENKKTTPVKQELVESIEELTAEQNAAKSVKKSVDDFDWDSMFGDLESNEVVSSEKTPDKKIIDDNSSLVGKAGTGTTQENNHTTSASSVSSWNQNQQDSTQTAENLENMSVKSYSTETAYAKTDVEIETLKSNNGSIAILLEDGKKRDLLFPTDPKIILPENTQIVRDIEVKVSFVVKADGTVPFSGIKISNEALLSKEIIDGIKNELVKWHFEESSSDGQASFNYSIIKK